VSEIGEQQRDDFTSPLQRLFDTAWATDKVENKEKPPKTGAAEIIVWLSLSNKFI